MTLKGFKEGEKDIFYLHRDSEKKPPNYKAIVMLEKYVKKNETADKVKKYCSKCKRKHKEGTRIFDDHLQYLS